MIKAVCFDAFGTICYFTMGRIEFFPVADAVMKELKGRGLMVGLISNINRMYGAYLLKKMPFKPDCVSFPYLSKSVKPEPGAFRYACEQLGCEPQEALMVGDSYNNDYMGAKNFGMQALYLDAAGHNMTTECIHDLSEVAGHAYLV